MKVKRITTMSGAKYNVYEDGRVERPATEAFISWTEHDFQYQEGFLQYNQSYDGLAIGGFVFWQGIVNEFTEPIRSSLIEEITEETI